MSRPITDPRSNGKWRLGFPAGLVGCALVACQAGDTEFKGEPAVTLTPKVWFAFEDYRKMNSPGAFAVSADGRNYGFSFCPTARCQPNYERPGALMNCREHGGDGCRIFAVGTRIVVPYEVRSQ